MARRHTESKWARGAKFSVTATVRVRFSTTCGRPPGTNTVSPARCTRNTAPLRAASEAISRNHCAAGIRTLLSISVCAGSTAQILSPSVSVFHAEVPSGSTCKAVPLRSGAMMTQRYGGRYDRPSKRLSPRQHVGGEYVSARARVGRPGSPNFESKIMSGSSSSVSCAYAAKSLSRSVASWSSSSLNASWPYRATRLSQDHSMPGHALPCADRSTATCRGTTCVLKKSRRGSILRVVSREAANARRALASNFDASFRFIQSADVHLGRATRFAIATAFCWDLLRSLS